MLKLLAMVAVMAANGAMAGPLDEAAAGRAALDRGDNLLAIRLLTDALRTDSLGRRERELALVKRADAELAADQAPLAIADANAALAIDKTDAEAADLKVRALQRTDAEAADVRVRAQVSVVGRGEAPAVAAAESLNGEVKHFNEGVAARNAASESDYETGVDQYHAEIRSDADDYSRAREAYEARVRNLDARHQAAMAAWRERVAACRHRREAQCEAPPN